MENFNLQNFENCTSKENIETSADYMDLTTKYKLVFPKGQLMVSKQGLDYNGFQL